MNCNNVICKYCAYIVHVSVHCTLYKNVHCTGLFGTEAENINCGETSVNDNYRLR